MKTLSEVIDLKSKLISISPTPLYSLLELRDELNVPQSFPIFSSKYKFSVRDEISLLKEITPLLVYFCSCVSFHNLDYDAFLVKLNF